MRYPGFGPWRHLPPWERPGWKYGRGRCWRFLPGRGYGGSAYGPYASEYTENEIEMLEEEAKFLEDRLNEVKRRLDEMRKR